jgi:hypothetical protein
MMPVRVMPARSEERVLHQLIERPHGVFITVG